MSKILVTGATGHLGKATIGFLLEKGFAASEIFALVRDENKAADLKQKGITLVKADYNDYGSLLNAFQEVDKLFFVSSSDVQNRGPQQENVVKAAKEAGVKHTVYTSALNNVPAEKSAIGFVAEAHINTEKLLAESGLSHTILRNNLYTDIVPMFIGERVLETGTIYLPAGNGKTAFTLRSDMAEAAANILRTDGHEGKVYNLTNVETYTYQDVADIIAKITGKKIVYISPSTEEFEQTLKGAGVPDEAIGALSSFAVAQAQNEFNIIGNDLEHLLGRKPTTLQEFLQTIYSKN